MAGNFVTRSFSGTCKWWSRRGSRDRFAEAGINIDDFIMDLPADVHLGNLHGNAGGPWNAAWAAFFQANPNADATAIFQQAGVMIFNFGIDGIALRP